ncbi:MAG: sigma-70 family RNA polymerase sigma factor [Clostridiales bacterium]|nr:sigma-70 family RNA polymerase sigma factor [Clostridiales bacterium]
MADNLHLLKLAKDGDREARDRLVTENMGLVMSIAKRYVGRGQDLEDLVQIGLIGLIKAVDRFDTDYEVKFSTYAVPLIQGELRRFLRDDGIVKVGRGLKALYYKAERYRQEIRKAQGKEPGVDEICKAIAVSPEDLMMAMEAASDVTCIDEINDEMTGREEGDMIVDRLYIYQMLDTLSENERRLIVMRYFENRTQGQIGNTLGMSQVQVSRLEKKILEKLRKQ